MLSRAGFTVAVAESGRQGLGLLAEDQPEDMLRGWSLGCDGYVVKPIDMNAMVPALPGVLTRGPADREAVGKANIARLSPLADPGVGPSIGTGCVTPHRREMDVHPRWRSLTAHR